MRKVFAIAALAALLAPLTAAAQGQPGQGQYRPAQLFKAWDKDGDGALTKDEWVAAGRRAQGFDYVDADHDGKVTLDELRTAMSKHAGS